MCEKAATRSDRKKRPWAAAAWLAQSERVSGRMQGSISWVPIYFGAVARTGRVSVYGGHCP